LYGKPIRVGKATPKVDPTLMGVNNAPNKDAEVSEGDAGGADGGGGGGGGD
jgi:hypothetical protein